MAGRPRDALKPVHQPRPEDCPFPIPRLRNSRVKAALEGALSSQNVDGLLGATGKRLKTGLSSVAFQIANDISPTISATVASTESTRARIVELPSILPNVAKTILSATESIAKETVGQIQGDIKDPSRIKQRVEEQQRALVRALSNENDLKGPRYEVLGETGSYESSGAAFNLLASYIFGSNSEKRVQEMTTPVEITREDVMRFYLGEEEVASYPEPVASDAAMPSEGAVGVTAVEGAVYAVAKFTGFATKGEVERQRDGLLRELEMAGVVVVQARRGGAVQGAAVRCAVQQPAFEEERAGGES